MHTRKTLGLNWWRNATVGGKLALWVGIALLLALPMPGVHGALGLAGAPEARPDRAGIMAAGNAFDLAGRAHPPTQSRRGPLQAQRRSPQTTLYRT